MPIHQYAILTSNPKKTTDFALAGFDVRTFTEDIPEILSSDVVEVAIHKAIDTRLSFIIVEDTSLAVDGLCIEGTLIKHIYPALSQDEQFQGKQAQWDTCVVAKSDSEIITAKGTLTGRLLYPRCDAGYAFESLFAVETDTGLVHFCSMDNETITQLNPRLIAIRLLKQALENPLFQHQHVTRRPIHSIQPWNGAYQEERPVHTLNIKLR